MALICLKCSNCGSKIQMDDANETGYCIHCGSKFLLHDEVQRIQVEHSGFVSIDRKSEAANLLIRAKQLVDQYEADKGFPFNLDPDLENNYFRKILDIDPTNFEAHLLAKRYADLKKRITHANNNKSDLGLLGALIVIGVIAVLGYFLFFS